MSGGGDQGADPNELVSITDNLAATTLPAGESFQTVLAPKWGTVYRGVSFTPGAVVGTNPSSTVVTGPTTPTTGVGVTYTATVTEPGGGPVDGGTVTFSDPGAQITGCMNLPVNAAGQVTCNVTFNGTPMDVITATYSGDPNYGPSSGNLPITVQPPVTTPEVPWTPLLPLSAVVLGGGVLWRSRRR